MSDARAPARQRPSQGFFGLVLSAYLLGVVALHRDFSHLHLTIAGLPLYIGELTIAVLLIAGLLAIARERTAPFTVDLPVLGVLVYLVAGAAFLAVGLARGHGTAALRDASLVYYSLFFLFTLFFLSRGGATETLLRVLAAGAAIGSALALAGFLIRPALTLGHGATSYQALNAWLGVLVIAHDPAARAGRWRPVGMVLAIGLCLATVFLSGYRTMLAVIAISLSVVWLGVLRRRGEGRVAATRAAATATAAAMALAIVTVLLWLGLRQDSAPLVIHGPTSARNVVRTVATRWATLAGLPEEAVSLTVEEEALAVDGEGNLAIEESADFRRTAWAKAVARIRASPLTGIGYGPPAALFPDEDCEVATSATSNCGNAHNTFLTIAMRMGLPVFLFFMGLNLVVVLRLLRRLWMQNLPPEEMVEGWLALAILAGFAVYGVMSLFLESPYLASVYWAVLALIAHLARSHPSTVGNA
jgi:hypothetical protein